MTALINRASNLNLDQSNEKEFVKECKEKYCYVSMDPLSEGKDFDDGKKPLIDVKLPDDKVVKLGKELYQCPEIMFDPKWGQSLVMNKEYKSLQELVQTSVERVDIGARKSQYENIILSGGSSMYENLAPRLEKEVGKLVPQTMKVKVYAQKDRKYSVWIGGAVLASLSTFKSQWITKEEYDEIGSNVMIKKCI